MPRTHLIFDLDDTLYPERDYAIGGFKAAAAWARADLGAHVDTDHMAHLLDTGHLGRLFAIVLKAAKPDHTDADLKAFVRAYGRQTPALRLFEDAAAALDHWEPKTPLGLITDGHAPTQHSKISALKLAPRFREIIATGGLGPDRAFHKPHPRAFELIQVAIGEPGDRYVYVGDNLEKDFVAPNALGWTTVCIDRPAQRAHRIHKNKSAPPGGEPHETIDDLRQLETLLG
jgi:putative hydrolase of the HAD superfamily